MYFMHYSLVVTILFSTSLYRSAFSTYSSDKTWFTSFCVFDFSCFYYFRFSFLLFSALCFESNVISKDLIKFLDFVLTLFKRSVNHIHDGSFWGLLKNEGGKKAALLNLSHISCNDGTWRFTKYLNHVTHYLSSANICIFSFEISKFCYIIDCF